MSLANFRVSTVNPNDDVGGAGCLCSPDGRPAECAPPYVVFHTAETASNSSPVAVVCQACVGTANTRLADLASETPVDHREPTVEFDALSDAQQTELRQLAQPGEIVTIPSGYVRVPEEEGAAA